MLKFNQIYCGSEANEKFHDVKPLLDAFVAGGIACVLNHGITGSGKTFTMFGSNISTGLLHRSGEYVLNTTKFKVSAFQVIGTTCSDLTNKRAITNENIQPEESIICSVDDFKRFVDRINANRTQKETTQNSQSSRSHLFVILSLENCDSKMAFVDLAGFESLDGNDMAESKFINTTLSELNTFLINITQNKVNRIPSFNKMLISLKPFIAPPAQAIILYHVRNGSLKKGLEYIKDIVSSTRELKRSGQPLVDVTNKIRI